MIGGFDDCSFEGVSDAIYQERRRGLRSSSRLHAAIFPDTREERESDEVEVLAINLTSHGIGMELPRDVPIGQVYNLNIGIGDELLHSHVKITSCMPVAEGVYRAGGEIC